jgi:MFS family permease
VIELSVWARTRRRLRDSARAFSTNTRNPNLRRVQLSFWAAWTAEWALTVAIGVVAFRDGGAEAVGIVAFVRMAPSALLAPLGTTLGDRLPRDRVLLVSCCIRAAATAGATAILAAGGSTVGVYALAVIATAAFTVYRPVHSALLPELSMTPLELTSANVVRGLLDSLSVLLGPAAAALLLAVGSPASVFGLAAGLSLWAGLLMLGLSYDRSPRGEARPLRLLAQETVEGFRVIARSRDAGLLVGIGLAQTFTRGCLNVFLVVVAIELLDAGAPGVGLLTAAIGAGAVVGSLGASMFAGGRRLATLEGLGVALWGIPLILSGAFAVEPVVIALMCVIGIGNALVDIGLFTGLPRLVPDETLARVFGAFEALIALTVAIGSLITPLVITLLGIRGALGVIGLVAPLLVVFAWPRLRAIDASITHRDEEIDVLKRVGMFRPLPMAAIDALALHVGHANFDTGEEIFHQGDEGDRFYVIDAGQADVIGDSLLVTTIGPGDGFGEIALLRDMLRTTTVRARTPLRLYTLERSHFLAAVGGYSSSARAADELVTGRLATLAQGP